MFEYSMLSVGFIGILPFIARFIFGYIFGFLANLYVKLKIRLEMRIVFTIICKLATIFHRNITKLIYVFQLIFFQHC